jgi:hypothetical protein
MVIDMPDETCAYIACFDFLSGLDLTNHLPNTKIVEES